jgi:hypothetical protein
MCSLSTCFGPSGKVVLVLNGKHPSGYTALHVEAACMGRALLYITGRQIDVQPGLLAGVDGTEAPMYQLLSW